jgi:tetratricopeptide (TPR) repeat protein
MTGSDEKADAAAIAVDIADQAADSLKAGRPLFLIVYYEHEAVKIAFLGKLRQALGTRGITPQTFDPGQRPEHGAGLLYPLLSAVAETQSLALITGFPRMPAGGDLDLSFLEYLNLHRDLIPRNHLRFVLFLHTADAGTFISSAGDLWDFRHHTYWLEGRPEAERLSLWEFPERASTIVRLSEEEKSTVNEHLEKVHYLIQQTAEPVEKASLFLDLSRWLFRRNLPSFAADAAFEGIELLPDKSSPLRGDLEFNLGYALRKDHQLAEALHHYRNALAISQEIRDRAGEGTTLNNISQIYRAWGRNEEALKTLEESLAIHREIGGRAGEALALNNIAHIYVAWGRNEEALKTLEESLAICREIGDRAGEGTTLNNISQIYDSWGRYDEALKTLEESLAIRREIGDRAGEGGALNNIAQIYRAWGRNEEALKMLEESLAISREIGARAIEGVILNNISLIYKVWGRNDEALKTLEESLFIRREIGDRAGEGITSRNLAMEYQRRGDLGKAGEYARCTVEIDEETNHPDLEKDRAFLQKLERTLAKRKKQPTLPA